MRRYKTSKFGVRLDAKGKADRTVDGILFHSKKEAMRYIQLKYMEQIGEIESLQRQISYRMWIDGILTGEVEAVFKRKIRYIADFVYQENGETVIEDVKGMRTKSFDEKWDLMQMAYPHNIYRIT